MSFIWTVEHSYFCANSGNPEFELCCGPIFCAVLCRFTFVQNSFPLLSSRGRFSKPKRLPGTPRGKQFSEFGCNERTRSMVHMIVCFNIEYTLLLLYCLQDTRRPMKIHFQRRAHALPPKGRDRTSRYNSVRSLSNPPLSTRFLRTF
jgi:hypothetical protein